MSKTLKPLPSRFKHWLLIGFLGSLLGAIAAAGFLTTQALRHMREATRDALPHSLTTPAQVYAHLGYRSSDIPSRRLTVPRVFLPALPQVLGTVRDTKHKKQIFLSVILPHILAENDRIARTRHTLEQIKGKADLGLELSGFEVDELAVLGAAYGLEADVALTLTAGPPIDIDELYRRIDIVPPDLALAQAAIESGWGTSRFAMTGNALFGQRTWGDDGILPLSRRAGAQHRINAFNDLGEAVEAYMHNLNTHDAYETLRRVRAEARADGKPLTGALLAPTLSLYSERREQYVKEVMTMIRANRLDRLSQARLEGTEIKR